MIGKPTCHLAPGVPLRMQKMPTRILPIITVTMHCQALSPSAMSEEPVVHPPMLKDPVMTHSVTNSHGPNVRRVGGRGKVSSLPR